MTKQIITAETVRLAWKAGESVIVYAKATSSPSRPRTMPGITA